MTAQQHILNEIEQLRQPDKSDGISQKDLEAALYAKVMSKKFRKLRVDEEGVAIVKKAIKLAVENDNPIIVSLLFGGNKLWRFEEAPEIDWAEVFSMIYYLRWMRGIASVYKNGVVFELYSQDVCVETMNNVPHEETDRYSEGFKALIEWLKPYTPKGVEVRYRRLIDECGGRQNYLTELEEAKKVVLERNDGELPNMDEAQKIATELNVKLKPGQDKESQWHEKIELEHQAIFSTKTLRAYLDDPSLIPTCPTWYEGLIATGSTKYSMAKFWAGVGALQRRGDDFADLILTPKQLESAKFDWEAVQLDGLNGKNFQRVRVLK